jgi:hypothetical protein
MKMPKRTPRLLVERTDPAATLPIDALAGKSSALGAPNCPQRPGEAGIGSPGLRSLDQSMPIRSVRIDPRPEAKAPTTAMIPLITAFLSPSVPLANHEVFDLEVYVGLVPPPPTPAG